MDDDETRIVNLDGGSPDKDRKVTPQPKPTDPRIKDLLSRALTTPESLSPDEVRAMAASIVYHLVNAKKH